MSEPPDPKRLSDAAQPSELGRLLSSATRDVPADRQIAALAERLGGVLGPATPRGPSVLLKLGIPAGLAALIAGGVFATRTHSAPPTSQSPAASESSRTVQRAAQPELNPSALPVATPPPSAVSAPGANVLRGPSLSPEPAKSAASPARAASEPELLERARRALSSNPSLALALTNQDAALFPHGVLLQEREVIAIEALRRLKRTAEADRRAAAFGKAFPGSAHQRAVEDAASK